MRLLGRPQRWIWLVLTVFLVGCDNTPNRPDPITIDIDGASPAVLAFNNHTFTSDRRGIATVTLAWSSGDLDFFATVSSCTTSPFLCGTRVQSRQVNTTTEVLTFGVTEGEVMRLWVQNFSASVGQAYTIEVRLE